MCESSRDILNLTIAASIAVLTFLIAWLLSYAIIATKAVMEVIHKIKKLTDEVDQTMMSLKTRVKEISVALPLVTKVVEKLMTYMDEKRKSKKSDINAKVK